jgi:hypothetical protein
MKSLGRILLVVAMVVGLVVAAAEARVKRSAAAKRYFLVAEGYKVQPTGYEVDHVIPLWAGGADKPDNMELLPREAHRQKTCDELPALRYWRQQKRAGQARGVE